MTRAYPIKSFKVMANSAYGDNRFRYPIFSRRDYDEYQSFMLRFTGQDYKYTFMRDPVLVRLAEDTGVLYQESGLCIMYLNGEYYSAMYLRENINEYTICREYGWEGDEDTIDYVKGGHEILNGSNDSYKEMDAWLQSHDAASQEAYEIVDSLIDIDNFVSYVALELYLGCPDTDNVKRYKNPNGDNKWKFALYDVDRALHGFEDDAFATLNKGNYATLYRTTLNNPVLRDRLLTRMGELLAGPLASEHVIQMTDDQLALIQPVQEQYWARWGVTAKRYRDSFAGLQSHINKRPLNLITQCTDQFNLSQDEIDRYFGAALAQINR